MICEANREHDEPFAESKLSMGEYPFLDWMMVGFGYAEPLFHTYASYGYKPNDFYAQPKKASLKKY